MPDAFEEHRPRLFSLAYRMLGSAHDAEDVVQTAWLRWSQAEDVREPAAFLTTVVTRLCLDELGAARRRRESYVGPWLPEPVATAELGPAETAQQREQVTLGALLLLEKLTPQQRAVCVLRDAFEYPYADVASVLGLSEAYCRQLHRRARARLAEDARPRYDVAADAHVELGLRLFLAALEGDLPALEAVLARDVVLVSDGGGLASAARRPVRSADHVARFVLGITAKVARGGAVVTADVAELNGARAILVREDGRITSSVFVESDGTRVHRLLLVVNPDKLSRLAAVTSGAAASSQG